MPLAKLRSTTILRPCCQQARFVFLRILACWNSSIGIGLRRRALRCFEEAVLRIW
jgi:hypothetical protein